MRAQALISVLSISLFSVNWKWHITFFGCICFPQLKNIRAELGDLTLWTKFIKIFSWKPSLQKMGETYIEKVANICFVIAIAVIAASK